MLKPWQNYKTIESKEPCSPGFAYLEARLVIHETPISLLWEFWSFLWRDAGVDEPVDLESFLELEVGGV